MGDTFAKNAFHVTIESFWENWSFCRRKVRLWFHFLNYRETRSSFLAHYFARDVKIEIHVPRDRFEKSSGIRVHFIFFSWNFSRKTWIGHTNYGFARKAFYVSSGTFQGTFMRRNQNFGHRAKKHLFLANRYWQSCQNSFACVQRSTLRKMNFCRKNIKFWIFFDFHQEILNLGKICCQEFKTIFKCPEKHFEKNFLWRKIQFNDFFLGFSKKRLTGKKSVSWMSGRQNTCLVERF